MNIDRLATRRGSLTMAPRTAALLVFLGSFSCHQGIQAATQLTAWGDSFGNAPADATNIVAMAGGDGHIVALRADGRVFAWGQNNYGQLNVPPDVTNAVRIAAGSTHSLALLDDGTVRFWGNIYTTGVTNPPLSAVANMVVLAPGGAAQHVLSVRSDGTAVDWGNSSYGLTNVPAKATNVIDAAVASFHALVLRADRTPVAWGLYGTYSPYGTPVVPSNATNVVAVASGFWNDLALRADGSLVGWGASSSEAMVPAEATNITAIACGGSQRLALRADGKLLAWYSGGQTSAVPSGLSNVVAIAATTGGNLALTASDGPPLLGRMPHNPVAAGATARVRALAISTTPLSYQWMCDGTNLPGATTATLVLSNAQPSQTGTYALVVSNAFGAVTNSDLAFNVLPFLIQAPPQSQTVAGGTTATFGVTAFGQGPFGYHWQFNGTNLAGATNNSLVLTNVQMNQAGMYSVVISNAIGTVTSPNASLGVVPLFITAQPQSLSTYVGGQANFSATTSGKGPYSYQWQFNGTNLPSATNNPLVLTNVQLGDAGPYSVAVTNAFGAVQSSNALLTVVPILLTAQPQSQAGFLGQTINFTVAAQAGVALSYQWQFNGSDLPGATTSSLTLTNCQYGRSGTYRLVVNTAAATTNSADASLTVAQVASWGSQGQAGVPAGLSNLLAVGGGAFHSLALRADRTVARWGDNTNVPAGLTNAVAVAAGDFHDLALKDDGTIIGWGLNSSGQTNVPSDLTNALAVAAGGTHSLALKPDGRVIAWGGNSSGQTNLPPDLTNVVAIAAGESHSLALRADGRVVAWGLNSSGQTNIPTGLSNVVAIAGGWIHSLALTADGRVVVWGDTGYGLPNVPASATNVVAIAAGYGHCVALKADRTVFAWGYSYDGETAVPGDLKNVVGIGAGRSHSLALVSDDTPRPQAPLANPAWGPSGFSVSLPTRSGRVYLLEYKNSLADSNWTGLPLVAGNGGVITLSDPTANGSQRFYRVRQW
jgi:alpha-tubulin suppressor-like RCC1 family protein